VIEPPAEAPPPPDAPEPSPLPAELWGADEALVVVAHPDDESFGLGGVLLALIRGGIRVRLLCLTAGEASTVGAGPELSLRRRQELQQAAQKLGLASAELLSLPDGGLASMSSADLEQTVDDRLGDSDLVVVFEPGGVTGHPDHRAATAAAEKVALGRGLLCLEWGLAREVAESLQQQFGVPFTHVEQMGSWPVEIIVDREGQRAAISCHLSQDPDNPVLERRLALEDNRELIYVRRPSLEAQLRRLARQLDRLASPSAPPDSRLQVLRRLLGLAATLSRDQLRGWSSSGALWRLSSVPDIDDGADSIWGAEAVISGMAMVSADQQGGSGVLLGPGSGRLWHPGDPPLRAASDSALRVLRLRVPGPG
jgi:LmbE family N-acetylglucosaminyl deacetylase